MLPRLFNRIEATRQTMKFYKPMHLAKQRMRQRGTGRKRATQIERVEKKKTITRLIYFHLGKERASKREREGERMSPFCF